MEGLLASVRLEDGIPKLLVKVSPGTAAGFAAKNLGEVTLRRPGSQRGHVAVLHLSSTVPTGVALISLKLAELLEVQEGQQVHIAHSERGARRSRRDPQELWSRRGSEQPGPVEFWQ
ncbi:unnamed protein product [Effrenium voratum]|uniref:Uncharacterized protein n=1 Tax=Effrenium voratum TaxID=2562239 RepID=A0AA36N852_9DINO|nr:unnamed protein product [Effrenium voratum]